MNTLSSGLWFLITLLAQPPLIPTKYDQFGIDGWTKIGGVGLIGIYGFGVLIGCWTNLSSIIIGFKLFKEMKLLSSIISGALPLTKEGF